MPCRHAQIAHRPAVKQAGTVALSAGNSELGSAAESAHPRTAGSAIASAAQQPTRRYTSLQIVVFNPGRSGRPGHDSMGCRDRGSPRGLFSAHAKVLRGLCVFPMSAVFWFSFVVSTARRTVHSAVSSCRRAVAGGSMGSAFTAASRFANKSGPSDTGATIAPSRMNCISWHLRLGLPANRISLFVAVGCQRHLPCQIVVCCRWGIPQAAHSYHKPREILK